MPKVKQAFICSSCGYESAKWLGNCPSCDSWNTFDEQIISKKTKVRLAAIKGASLLSEIQIDNTQRFSTGDPELDRVLGGGIVPGQVILVGGEPGIGKSTLLLQLALRSGLKSLYISGEESGSQIKLRVQRLQKETSGIDCHISSEIEVQQIVHQAKNIKPDFLIVDSIQTLRNSMYDPAPGSITQIRECTMELQRYAKESNVAIFIIGHINKEGSIAGPKILEHIVDTVLQFEGERNHSYRMLRCLKNRFGTIDTLGIYDMTSTGLERITNPSGLLLSQREENLSGNVISAIADGQRAILVETQALVSTAVYGTPQRSSTGYDIRRLSMLLAVLEKRCGFYFGQNDVFLNIAGGLKVNDPAIDLGICAALVSSLENIPISSEWCFAGEVGLSGEVRSVSKLDVRIKEAEKLGFEKVFISKYGLKKESLSNYQIEVVPIGDLRALMEILLG
jgi:DNA repair protein RadA/Sms